MVVGRSKLPAWCTLTLTLLLMSSSWQRRICNGATPSSLTCLGLIANICMLLQTQPCTLIHMCKVTLKSACAPRCFMTSDQQILHSSPCLDVLLSDMHHTDTAKKYGATKVVPGFTLSSHAVWWREGQVMGEEVFSGLQNAAGHKFMQHHMHQLLQLQWVLQVELTYQSVLPRYLHLLEKRPALKSISLVQVVRWDCMICLQRYTDR